MIDAAIFNARAVHQAKALKHEACDPKIVTLETFFVDTTDQYLAEVFLDLPLSAFRRQKVCKGL